MSKPGVQRLAWLAIALGLGGCDRSPAALAQEAADRAEFESSIQAGRELDQELDALEARLHSGRATVRLWSELADRHQQVTQIACENAQMHADAMAAIERRDRARAQQLRRNRLAESHRGLASDVNVTGYDRAQPSSDRLQGERPEP